MRHHGWELPYHPLQVVAVAVFFALVFAFYVFFIPFLGYEILEILVVASYSPTVVLVFLLYIWCVATDPADVGVLNSKQRGVSENKAAAFSVTSSRETGKEKEPTVEPQVENQEAGEVISANDSKRHCPISFFAGVCLPETGCSGQSCTLKSSTNLSSAENGVLYCSLCKVEIFNNSKHCRVCDKCVDGFDHHCRWLNNCVGRKNYKGFLILMISGIGMLILQWSAGLWVLVHCFLNLRHFKNVIASKLGSSFSSVAYIGVVAVCTLLAMVATYPLAQLLFFHVLLIKKGITTYDYVVAMREQDLKVGGESAQSPYTSPTSSIATANSGASSAGGFQGRAWCTPPRLFFDDEGVYAAESSISTKGSDRAVALQASGEGSLRRKTSVKINPWALASLNKEDVLHAANVARSKSSILRPVAPIAEKTVVAETDGSSFDSSRDISTEFIPSSGNRNANKRLAEVNLNLTDPSLMRSSGKNRKLPEDFLEQLNGKGKEFGNRTRHVERGKKTMNPLQMEARNVFNTSHAFSGGGIKVSSSESSGASSEAQHSMGHLSDTIESPPLATVPRDWSEIIGLSATDVYDASGGDNTDGSDSARILQRTINEQKALLDAYHGHLQYPPLRRNIGLDMSGRPSDNFLRRSDEIRGNSNSMKHAECDYQNVLASAEVPSQMGSRERTRISKYMVVEPNG